MAAVQSVQVSGPRALSVNGNGTIHFEPGVPSSSGLHKSAVAQQKAAMQTHRDEFVGSFLGDALKKSRSRRREKGSFIETRRAVPRTYSKQSSSSLISTDSDVFESLPVIIQPATRKESTPFTSITNSPNAKLDKLPDLSGYSGYNKIANLEARRGSQRMDPPVKSISRRGSSSLSTESGADQDDGSHENTDKARRGLRKSSEFVFSTSGGGTSRRGSKWSSGQAEMESDLGAITELHEGSTSEHTRANQRLIRRQELGAKFRRLGHFMKVLFALWRSHANRVQKFMENNIDLIEIGQPMDLLFDVTEYRADKQARVSQDTKRILMKRPKERTPEEVRYVQIALGNYPSIAEYPLRMTKLIAQRAWYEKYDGRRVIVRQGHVSRCFYFILNGSVIVTRMEGSEISKTVCFLNRGESFGDLGLVSNAPRQASVVSKEPVELLVFGDEDYVEVFMSGGLKDPDDPFLKTLPYFRGWPLDLIADNPNIAFLSYFKRGSVLVYDSKYSDWLFIVKTGSAKILKKLKNAKPTSTGGSVDEEEGTSHEDVLNARMRKVEARWDRKSYAYRGRNLHDLDLKIELLPLPRRENPTSMINIVLSAEEAEKGHPPTDSTLGPAGDAASVSQVTSRDSSSDRLSGPFITKTEGMHFNMPAVIIQDENKEHISDAQETMETPNSTGKKNKLRIPIDAKKTKQGRLRNENKTLTDELNERFLLKHIEETEADYDPIFVRVETLTKGSVFGLSELIHDDQPSMSLVSNGAEFIIVQKKFYTDHMSKGLMNSLRTNVCPYPSEDELKEFLQIYVDWENNKSHVFADTVMSNQWKKVNVHDARSTLQLRQSTPKVV